MRLYDSIIPSGNSYKVHLLLAQLRKQYHVTDLDILSTPSQTRTPAFLAKNPNGRIPLLELDDGRLLPESNAILYYLAEGTPFLSSDPFERAQTLQWMFFEQYSHERFVAVLKFWTYWGGLDKLSSTEREMLQKRGQDALDVMETHLAKRSFFVADRYSIADITLFAYTQSADAIGYRTGPAVRAWLGRVRDMPHHVPIKADPLGKAP
ncbi:MAG TPA: glutathione S-transferase family protein [Polyangiales bacterium]|nr:glutathione S-transferase family protein [Polyangiales bacterium]